MRLPLPMPDNSSICLRMKGVKYIADAQALECSFNAAVDSLMIMQSQDAQYCCGDYLSRCHRGTKGSKDLGVHGVESMSTKDGEEPLDVICREKMVDWAMRVSDHFQTRREIVSYAFSFLDRFVDRCPCDRTSFKLASMTSLYMATKLFNPKQISIVSLAELSRGEFDVAHIAEMERVILKELDWKLNPPTVQSFVGLLQVFLSLEDSVLRSAVYQRAIFFAELALYDYLLVPMSRLQIAIASILNALEGIDDSQESRQMQEDFHHDVERALVTKIPLEAIDDVQARLWFLYSCSAQLEDDDAFLHQSSKRQVVRKVSIQGMESFAHSPVSVRQTRQY